jgi:putative transposase
MAQRSVEMKLALLREHEDGVPWVRIAEDSGVPARTLRRWAAAYRADPTSLRRPARSDKGQRRTPAELIEAAEALALRHPTPTTAYIHRRVSDIARDRGLPAPSYSSIRSTVQAVDPGLRTLATKGDAAYRDRFELRVPPQR